MISSKVLLFSEFRGSIPAKETKPLPIAIRFCILNSKTYTMPKLTVQMQPTTRIVINLELLHDQAKFMVLFEAEL